MSGVLSPCHLSVLDGWVPSERGKELGGAHPHPGCLGSCLVLGWQTRLKEEAWGEGAPQTMDCPQPEPLAAPLCPDGRNPGSWLL